MILIRMIMMIAFAVPCAVLANSTPRLPVPEIETLPNGLVVAWFINDHLPVVDLALLVKSGFRDDPTGKSGTAEFLAAGLDRGSAGLSSQEIARSVEKLGASRYISAEADTFTLGMHGLAPDGEALLDLLGKTALRPDFPPKEMEREHRRILDRWNHIGDYGESLVTLGFHRVLTAGTSYGRGNLLSSREFKKVGREDAVRFYQKHFTPGNSVLMIVGRVNRVRIKEQILRIFGSWNGSIPRREWRNFTDSRVSGRKGEILVIHRPNLTQAQIRIGFQAPLIHAPEHYSLVVANALLGEYFSSRLVSLIRDRLGLTYAIGSSFSYNKDFAGFVVTSATRNEMVGQLVNKVLEVLRNLKMGPIPPDEVKMAKDYLKGGFPLSTATLGSVASRWMAGYIFDLGPHYLNEFLPKVEAVTAEDVSAAIVKDFKMDQLVIVVAGDAEKIEPGLKSSKLGPYRRISVQDLM